tara:strand:- start:230 stop:373 length:144 start_codon:yes stop_codon:yes gene_type:complete
MWGWRIQIMSLKINPNPNPKPNPNLHNNGRHLGFLMGIKITGDSPLK